MPMKIKLHEKQSAYSLWKKNKDSILSNLKKAYDFFDNLDMSEKKNWGEAGTLGMLAEDVDRLMADLKESGYME